MIHRNITNYQYELDILRALACFLVIWQHVTECYYIQPDFTINNSPDITMIGWINSLTTFCHDIRVFPFTHEK